MAKSTKSIQATTVAEYIKVFPTNIQKSLKEVRATIREVVPDAEESIKYSIPTFTSNGAMVSFAGWKIMLVFTRHRQELKNLKKRFQHIRVQKARLNFH